jgi:hypothetical protein
MKRKALTFIAFLSFCFSLVVIYGIAGAVDCNEVSVNDAFVKFIKIIPILIIDAVIVSRFYVDGKWRV